MTAQLAPAQVIFFQAEYGRHRRNPTTALLLCALLGGFGAHYLYFGRHRAGITRLLFCWTLVPAVLALFDAHTMTARALRYNASLANELLLAVKGAVEEVPDQAHRVIASRPRARMGAADLAVLASPRPAEHAVMDAEWAEHDRLETGLADASDASDAARWYEEMAPVAAASADPTSTDGSAYPRYTRAAPDLSAMANTATAESAIPLNGAHADDSSLWPGAVARQDVSRWPVMSEPAAADTTDAPAIWPVAEEPLASGDETAYGDPFAVAYAAAFAADSVPADARLFQALDAPDSVSASASPWTADAREPVLAPTTEEREPVLMYQVAPALRRESVHVGPALPTRYHTAGADDPGLSPAYLDAADDPASLSAYHETPDALAAPAAFPRGQHDDGAEDGAEDDTVAFPWASARPAATSSPRRATPSRPAGASHSGEQGAIAALGSALAFGLADLLRDHARTRPLTGPPSPESIPLHALPRPAEAEMSQPDPFARTSTAAAPWSDATAAPSTPLTFVAPPRTRLDEPFDAPRDAWASTERPYDAPVVPDAPAATLATALAGAALYPAREETPARYAPPIAPMTTLAEPALAAPLTPAVRRRLVQRVIVRKMAVLDGQVVAESTVERQVPVAADDHEMAQRIELATLDASREALNSLLMQAPEEARPSIQRQLRDLPPARV
jgi:TM2 domain-containing membrane protein YozV